MKNPRRFLAWILAPLLVLGAARAQVPYTGGTYVQDFNTLPASGTFTLTGAGPIALDTAPVGAAGLAGWSLAKNTGSGTNVLFFVGTGSSTTGGAYSFGAAAAPDRALGSLASGTMASRFGLVLTNSTGATISQFTLGYTGEQWRHGGATTPNKLTFSYSVGGTSISAGTFTAAAALDFTGLSTSTTAGALDGNAPANRAPISSTITGLNWGPGQTLVLRWVDVDDAGSDDGLAIDDLTFTTPTGPGGAVPAVNTTTPADGAVNLSPATTIVVNFNLPVSVTGSWFTLTGSISGPHTAAVAGGPATYTLTPSPVFAEGETVTLTVLASQVTDAATNTKHPAADFTSSFNTLSTAPLPIHTIQGAGTISAYVGQMQTVQGIVTASFQTGGLGGFYVQAAETDYDSDPATSEGLFVFNTSFPVSVGDVVKVSGTVAEFGSAPSTQTELTSVTYVTKLGTAALPAPAELTLPFATTTSAERYEGMRVILPQTLTVTNNFDLGRFGEIVLSNGRLPTPTNIVPPGAPAIAQGVANFLNQIAVDDGLSAAYPHPTPYLADSAGRGLTRRTGSTATGVTGILDEKFGNYIIEPTAPIAFTDANPRGDPPAVGGSLRVTLANVLNYFNGDGAGGGFPTSRGADTLAEFQRQRAKLIAAILQLAPDIMGLTEVENDRITNGLPHSYGPASALADLVNGLNAAAPAGTTYAYVDASAVDIVTDQIHNAFIYRTETVAPVGPPAMLDSPYFNNLARNPLAQTFREIATQQVLTVCINHFRAKGSAATSPASTDGIVPNPNLDTGDGQGTNKYLRKRQAEVLAAWLATDPTGSGDPDFLIIGDLNAYAREDALVALEASGYLNLAVAAEGPEGYSYAFAGEFGHLDHALANLHLAEQVADVDTWHVNSDEPVYYDYNLENKNAAQQAINAGGPYRNSDHDPVIIGLNLHPEYSAPSFTLHPAAQTVVLGSPVTFTATATGYPVPSLQWQKNGVDLPGATGGAYTLAAATMADAGSYTAVATNSQGAATSTPATLVVQDVTPPVLSLPANQTVEATGPGGATVSFSASALDNVDGAVPVVLTPASGSTFPLGTTTVTASATDAAGNQATGAFTVTVVDTTAPLFASLTASVTQLWPANHKMVSVTLTGTATDAASAPVTFSILSALSNEPDNGTGDGDTAGDIAITGPMQLNLRAERAGSGNGRIYTITVEARDAAGNASTRTVTVTVPKNQGK